jgi:putative PIN family toxin of toxin-antitoxin system
VGARTPAPSGEGGLPAPLSVPLVVVDTSVVIAHLTSSTENSDSGRVLRACGTGSLRTALSYDGLRELAEVARRPSVERQIKSASRALMAAMDLWSHGKLYYPTKIDWPTVLDRKDHWVLDLAWEAEADYIVSEDTHLTGPTMPFPVEVCESGELLDALSLS